MKKLASLLMASLYILLTSCTLNTNLSAVNDANASLQVNCKQPRSKLCTREYMPVCATVKGKKINQHKTFSNGCTACANVNVTSYLIGECNGQKHWFIFNIKTISHIKYGGDSVFCDKKLIYNQ